MAITQAMCTSFKQECMVGTHNLTLTTGDVIKVALYTSSATLSSATTAYSTTNEVSGTGYTAGGVTLTNVTPTTSGIVAYASFGNAAWIGATITARGALIYNSSQANKAIGVLDFDEDKTATAGDFTIQFPTADSNNALLRFE